MQKPSQLFELRGEFRNCYCICRCILKQTEEQSTKLMLQENLLHYKQSLMTALILLSGTKKKNVTAGVTTP
jgi:hypothetical protein